MICKNCGYENQENVKFCSNCGKPIVNETSSQQETQQNNGQYGNAPYNNVPQNNGQYGNAPYNNAPQNNGQYGNVPYNNAPQNNGQYRNMPYNNGQQGNFQPQNGMPQYNNYPIQNNKKKSPLPIILAIVAVVVVVAIGAVAAFYFLGNDSKDNSKSGGTDTTVTTTVPEGNSIDDVIGFFNDGLSNGDIETLKKCVPSFMAGDLDEQATSIESAFSIYKDKAKITVSKKSEKDITNDKYTNNSSTKSSSLSWKDYIQKELEKKTGYDGGKVTEVKEVSLNIRIDITDAATKKAMEDAGESASMTQSSEIQFYKYGNDWFIYDMN